MNLMTKFFSNQLLDSKVKTQEVQKKEQFFGYLIGPVGALLLNAGGVICWLFPYNKPMFLTEQFIKNIGGLPAAYIFMALFADVLDHIEWKVNFRCDGVAMSIYNIIAVTLGGICVGIFNALLAKSGYVAPYYDKLGNLIAVQNESVQDAITFSFVGLETITGLIMIVLFFAINVEKDIFKKQQIIKERQVKEDV
jgi:glycoside/pentoside/hexuronide:cation symporter, GPH family